jgi:hypothetical protein
MAIVLALFALGSVANAAWMLAAPHHWYFNLPGQVPDFGPYNEHLVRDLGCLYMTTGLALGLAARRPRWRLPLVALVATFNALHAVLHVFDTVRGYVSAQHWYLDFPGVYGPALALVGLTLWIGRRPESNEGP